MATAFSATVVGLGSSSLSTKTAFSASSGFLKPTVGVRNPLSLGAGVSNVNRIKCNSFQRDWLRRDLNVIGFGLIGWLAPSSIPAIDGKSLSGLFFESIGTELAHFPTPPALTSQFWVVVSDVASGFVHLPDIWTDWIQGKD
ncbi:Photosystem I subunit O [Linum perenne]